MRNFLSVILLIVLAGCSTVPPMTKQQKRAIQMKNFETSYDNVFKAFKTVLQDDGYIIKNQDFEGGMLLAQKERDINEGKSGFGKFMSVMARSKNDPTGKGFDLSVSFDKINDKTTETRLILQEMTKWSSGGSKGREVVDAPLYKAIYDDVAIEVKRREARGL